MSPRRAVPAACVAGAVLADTVIATAGTAVPTAPIVTLAAVVGVGLARGTRVGALAGFAVGVVLDLLSGPAALGGVATLTCVTIGASAGGLTRHARASHVGTPAVGAVLVACSTIVGLSAQGLTGWAPIVAAPLVACAGAVGLLVTPVVRHWSEDLTDRSVPKRSCHAYNPR